jgi:hypothetical protein
LTVSFCGAPLTPQYPSHHPNWFYCSSMFNLISSFFFSFIFEKSWYFAGNFREFSSLIEQEGRKDLCLPPTPFYYFNFKFLISERRKIAIISTNINEYQSFRTIISTPTSFFPANQFIFFFRCFRPDSWHCFVHTDYF